MVRRILPSVLTALAVVALPQIIAAAEAERTRPAAGPRRGAEQLFSRLDANDDGKVTLDEIPQRAPDHIKTLLKRADKDRDKSVSKDELAGAMKNVQNIFRRRPPGPPDARSRPTRATGPGHFGSTRRGGRPGPPDARTGPSRRPGPPDARSRPTRPTGPGQFGGMRRGGRPGAWDAWTRATRPSAGRAMRGPRGRGGPPFAGPQRRGGPPFAGPRGGRPDPKVVFARLDRDKDKKLSLEEFAAGMRQLHRARPSHGRPTTRGPARPSFHGPMGPPFHGPMGPPARRSAPPRAAAAPRLGMLGTDLFKKADANRDGKVSVEEARKPVAGAAGRANERRKQFFAEMAERARAAQGPPRRPGPGDDSEMRRGGRRGPPGAMQGPPRRRGPGDDSEVRGGGRRGPPGAMQVPPRRGDLGDAMPSGGGGQRGLWDGW